MGLLFTVQAVSLGLASQVVIVPARPKHRATQLVRHLVDNAHDGVAKKKDADRAKRRSNYPGVRPNLNPGLAKRLGKHQHEQNCEILRKPKSDWYCEQGAQQHVNDEQPRHETKVCPQVNDKRCTHAPLLSLETDGTWYLTY